MAGEVNEDGNAEVSDDATPHIPFAAPKRFIYETFINPANPLPVGTSRGPLIDFFLDMQAELQVAEARYAWDSEFEDCLILDPDCYERTKTLTVETVRGPKVTQIQYNNCEADFFCALDPGDLAADLTIDNLVETYLEHWIEDIEDGLKNWSDLGLASTKALFDPRSRRAAQNHICRNEPDDENSLLRRNCEDGVGPLDVMTYESEDFINDHLISMLGAPDLVGDLNELFGVVSDTLDDVLGPALNPLQAPIAEIKEYAKDLIKEKIEEELHIDVDQLKSFVTSPTHWLGVQSVSLDAARPRHAAARPLRARDAHQARHADGAAGRSPHRPAGDAAGRGDDPQHRPQGRGGVRRRAVRGLPQHRADGEAAAARRQRPQRRARRHPGRPRGRQGLRLDLRGRRQPDGHQLSGSVPWLRSIDSDHSWRSDGRPRFCSAEDPACPGGSGATPRDEELDAGNDTFPLWESCLLRPTFTTLYRDWENGNAQFPALGDAPSADPSDPDAPVARSASAATRYTSGGVTYVGADHAFTAGASRRRVHRRPDRRPVPHHQGGQHPGRVARHRARTGRSRSRPAAATAPTRCSCAPPIRATRSTRRTRSRRARR